MTSTVPRLVVRMAHLPDDMPAIIAIRRRVFIEEQRVTANVGFDVHDRAAYHTVALVAGAVVGAGRLHITGHEAQIAWVAVLPEYRQHGVGRAIVQRLIEVADAVGVEVILLNAQTHALRFYQRLGFRAVGSTFIMGGIEHQLMSRRRPPAVLELD